jgi:hypothetical protein
LSDDTSESARRILLACVPGTMSFWIDDTSIIHSVVPERLAPALEPLMLGTYSIGGASLAHIEGDLVAARLERVRSWIE